MLPSMRGRTRCAAVRAARPYALRGRTRCAVPYARASTGRGRFRSRPAPVSSDCLCARACVQGTSLCTPLYKSLCTSLYTSLCTPLCTPLYKSLCTSLYTSLCTSLYTSLYEGTCLNFLHKPARAYRCGALPCACAYMHARQEARACTRRAPPRVCAPICACTRRHLRHGPWPTGSSSRYCYWGRPALAPTSRAAGCRAWRCSGQALAGCRAWRCSGQALG
jgi:hypothetical protein